jgi:hypothetical protein
VADKPPLTEKALIESAQELYYPPLTEEQVRDRDADVHVGGGGVYRAANPRRAAFLAELLNDLIGEPLLQERVLRTFVELGLLVPERG